MTSPLTTQLNFKDFSQLTKVAIVNQVGKRAITIRARQLLWMAPRVVYLYLKCITSKLYRVTKYSTFNWLYFIWNWPLNCEFSFTHSFVISPPPTRTHIHTHTSRPFQNIYLDMILWYFFYRDLRKGEGRSRTFVLLAWCPFIDLFRWNI